MAIAPGRGGRPKPVALKLAAGSPGHRKLNTNEPKYDEITNIDPPDWLLPDARGIWETLAPQLCKQRVLKITDIQNLELYCDAYARFRLGQQSIAEHGLVIVQEDGKLMKNPAATAINEATRQMVSVGSLLGLDPSSRQRLTGAGNGKQQNPFADLIKG